MGRRERWAAAVLTIAALIVLNEARKLRVGTVVAPGPGFFPLVLGAAFCLVSLALLVRALRTAAPPEPAGAGPADRLGRWKVAGIITALVGYAFALESLGFVVATFALLVFFFRALEGQRWVAAVGGSLAVSLLTFVVFKLWLQVSLPPGPWGF